MRTSWRSSLRVRMALLYGALVLLVGVSLLITSIYLIDRSIAQSPLYAGSFGKLKITDGTGRTLFEGDPAVLGVTARSEARSYLLHTGLIYFLVVVVIGASGGYLLAKQALRPLAQMSAMARKIGTETLDERIHLGGPADELRELADTFDDMIERLEAAFASQRLFVANASHELRTPLSVMRTELDVTLSDPDASVQDLRQMGDVVLGATERAQRLVGSLLILARLQAGEVAELEMHEEVDLAAIVPGVVSTVEAEMRDRGIAVDKDLQPAPTVGDPRLLERLIGNLVENAVRHNVADGWLRILTGIDRSAGVNEGRAFVQVSNGGPIIPPNDVDALFQPFRRGGRVRTATRGAGLGLSIVRLIVNAHHGQLQATAPPTGGLSVRIELPLAVDEPLVPAADAAGTWESGPAPAAAGTSASD